MLCAWEHLPRAQPSLLSVSSWHFANTSACDTCSDTCSDTCTDTCSDTCSDAGPDTDDNDAGQHIDTPGGRMQVILRAELGHMVVQVFMGLLYRVSAMHSNNHHYNSNPSYLQAFVRGQWEALEQIVQERKVSWL